MYLRILLLTPLYLSACSPSSDVLMGAPVREYDVLAVTGSVGSAVSLFVLTISTG